jgi:xylulose-5-phosphate/fructose-6-phosphate phosphoketolase
LKWDKDLSSDGRVIEMLSEHALFGLMQGYVLTGRHGIFASYEAFVQIISSMADQYLKFLKVSRDIIWRRGYSSINIILTSSGWRQDHNGFSHQNPGFISDMLERDENFVKVYFPVDGNTTLAVLEKVMNSKDGLNLIVAGKTVEPRWLTIKQAQKLVEEEIMIWDFVSSKDPDFVICGIGDYLTKECIAAIDLLKTEIPEIKLRFVNILEPSILKRIDFDKFFTKDKSVLFNFHGYPGVLKKFLFDQNHTSRFEVRGYIENGSTTTPFDMHVRNKTSRWHILIHVVTTLCEQNKLDSEIVTAIIEKYKNKFEEHQKYIIENGVDLPEIENWKQK